MDHTGT